MANNEKQRIDRKLKDVFDLYKKQGKVVSFPEFSRLAADKMIEDMKRKKKTRFLL